MPRTAVGNLNRSGATKASMTSGVMNKALGVRTSGTKVGKQAKHLEVVLGINMMQVRNLLALGMNTMLSMSMLGMQYMCSICSR